MRGSAATAAVIFDLDDTLFDHQAAALAGAQGWLASLGYEPSAALIDYWFEVERLHFPRYTRGELSLAEQRRLRLRDMLERVGHERQSDAELDLMFEAFRAGYREAWQAFDDVDATLTMVQARGLRTAVLTNGDDAGSRDKLAILALTERVGPLFSGETLSFHKPDVRAFHAVCDALEVTPGAALYVGDLYEVDVLPARKAGLRAVHLDRFGTCPHPDEARIASLLELEGFLEGGSLPSQTLDSPHAGQ